MKIIIVVAVVVVLASAGVFSWLKLRQEKSVVVKFQNEESKDGAGVTGFGGDAPSEVAYKESYPGELRDRVNARMKTRKLELAGTGLVEFAEKQRNEE